MNCSRCGFVLAGQEAYCPRCGTAIATPVKKATPPSTTPQGDRATQILVAILAFVAACLMNEFLHSIAAWIGIVALLIFAAGWSLTTIGYRRKIGFVMLSIVLIVYVEAFERFRIQREAERQNMQRQTQSQTTLPAKSRAEVDPRVELLNDAKKTAREQYVTKMQDEFRNHGLDATISDYEGELLVVSDLLKLKPNRDQLMRSTFDPSYRKSLCIAGFRTVKLTSGILFGNGDTYSLGCPETKEERQARLEAQKSQRQEFVDQLQKRFDSNAGIAALGIRVEQGTDELILTSPSVKDMSPKMLQSMFASEFGDGSSNKLCGVGFRGLRMRSSRSNSGTFISFGCGKAGT